ncbi:MAG TPA: AraC family transcriptional regulator [Clostridiales bacterium]|nr:AraC family transcriptional regulator [Clostridiales bacterium]
MTILCQKYTTNRDRPFIISSGRGTYFPYHWHDEIELLYVLEGSMTFVIGPKAYNINKRDIVIVKSGEVHRFEAKVACSHLFVEFGHYLDTDLFKLPILIYPGMLSVLRAQNGSREDLNQLHSKVESLMLDMLTEYNQKTDGWEFSVKASLYRIIVLLTRAFYDKIEIEVEHKNITRGYTEILQEVFEYIEGHYNENITIEDVSEIANFSRHYFNKFFKKATGKTFASYINDIRLEKAQAFLKSSNQNITNIAYDVGFNSVKTFNRLFKESFGCTPSEYRGSVRAL